MPRRKTPTRELNLAARKPGGEDILEAEAQVNRASTDFLKIDLQTALTFSGIALESDNNEEKRQRNQRSARRGYDTIVRLSKKVNLSASDARSMSRNMARLKSELRQLGETF